MMAPSERRSREIRSARARRRPPSFAATLFALIIVFGLAWVFFVRSGPSASAPVVDGVQGTYTWQPVAGSIGLKGTFGAAADGDAGGSARPDAPSLGATPTQSAYRAGSRTESTFAGPGAPQYRRIVGEWPPVWRVATHSPLDYQGLAAIVRTAVEDGDVSVGTKPVKDGDRAAWRAAMTLGGRPVELVVDQQTGIVTWYTDGRSTFTATVDWASPPAAIATYSVDAQGRQVTTRTDEVFSYVASPAEAGRAAGYDPLVSDLAPDGYSLKDVATFGVGARPLTWIRGAAYGPPPDAPEDLGIAMLYTRGLSSMTIEQIGPKAMRYYAGVLSGELDQARSQKLSFQETTLQYGAFRGATASTWYQESGPSLFVAGRRRAVFVTGALTRQELISYAEGLKPVPAAK